MLENFSNASNAERLLYSPQKALDLALDLGAAPQRLFRVLYPIWRVQIEGRQRISQDFEEVEWFIERGIQEAGLNSVPILARFFGLEERFVNKVVDFLQDIGHLKNEQGQLSLTELGRASVQQGVRLQERDAVLYFDGIGSRPLKLEHASLPFYPAPGEDRAFQTFHLFSRRWQKEALQQLQNRADREAYNLPDEVKKLEALDQALVYLPVYIIQRRPAPPEDLPLFLAFSRIPGMRDEVLEQAINHEPLVQVPLRQANQNDLEDAVKQALTQRGLEQEMWYLQVKGAWGPQVMIAAEALKRGRDETKENGLGFGVGQIGKYLLARDWCVWLTCDDPEVCQQAATEQLLAWLQHVTATPTAAEFQQRLAALHKRLKIKSIPLPTLLQAAARRGLGRALERLDAMVVETEPGEAMSQLGGLASR